ncbi:outer membrane beta-barrel protein [Nannocystaceae bacterium ST9]
MSFAITSLPNVEFALQALAQPPEAADPGPLVEPPTAPSEPSQPAIEPPVERPSISEEELDRLIDERLRERGLIDEQGKPTPPPTPPTPEPALAPPPPEPPAPAVDERFAPRREAFMWGDFSWMPANHAPNEAPLKWGPFTGEIRVDAVYHYSLRNPKDNTISGSSEVFRHNELQLTQIGFGGNFFYKNVHARLMTQFGMYSQTTPRNDASYERGNWRLDNAYRYISEAYAGYHIPVLYGINIQAGIFMSYVGLWSYYNSDNWTYQPSYVSSNTPWFFNGARIQFFPTKKLKLEAWLVNGWQSYAKFNDAPGVGLQIAWRPREWLAFVGNQYYGTDTLGVPDRRRLHTDDSVMVRYFDRPNGAFSKGALSLTLDAGCEHGGGVTCSDQYFLGFMAYNRLWFWKNKLAFTAGGGAITNPGRYLVLIPPINGATSFSGTPYFPASPGTKYQAWDAQATLDFMPTTFVTFRLEYNHRAANTPYFSGRGGVTPPGGNQGPAGSLVENWTPDLVRTEDRFSLAMMVRY